MRKKHKKNKVTTNYSETTGCGDPQNDCGGNCKCSDIENTETDDNKKILSIDIEDEWKTKNMEALAFFNNKLTTSMKVPNIYEKIVNNKKYIIGNKKYITLIGSFLVGYGTSCLVKSLKSYR